MSLAVDEPKRVEFLMNEVEHLRREHAGSIEETRRLERYAVLVTGGAWSWCVTHAQGAGYDVVVWFPALVVALFSLRAASLYMRSLSVRKYVARIESALELPAGMGWEREQLGRRGAPAVPALTAYLFWAIMGVGTVVAPLLYG